MALKNILTANLLDAERTKKIPGDCYYCRDTKETWWVAADGSVICLNDLSLGISKSTRAYGPQGAAGKNGADSNVPGPKGDKGAAGKNGADSNVPGPKGERGEKGDAIKGEKGDRGLNNG